MGLSRKTIKIPDMIDKEINRVRPAVKSAEHIQNQQQHSNEQHFNIQSVLQGLFFSVFLRSEGG